ncbi:hypothetical protein [Streptomyces sp. WELS2]|uniref:hypothetical protein n=1 Tax=Streptomyces sp. WELS2 TaxID=2749435 RepID=UPI0015EFEDA9|nr:hypothetical protein [Streptomyces sp. WELS2]
MPVSLIRSSIRAVLRCVVSTAARTSRPASTAGAGDDAADVVCSLPPAARPPEADEQPDASTAMALTPTRVAERRM